MKNILLSFVCAATVTAAHANMIEVSLDPTTHTPSDVSFQDVVGGANSNQLILSWLNGEILSYFNNLGVQLPDPTTGLIKYDDLKGTPPVGGVSVEAGDYAVVHYGTGRGGVPGGGLVAFYFDAAQTFNADANGSGPNGFGGISFIDIFDHVSVPDGGSTVLLLGIALAGLGFFARPRKVRV